MTSRRLALVLCLLSSCQLAAQVDAQDKEEAAKARRFVLNQTLQEKKELVDQLAPVRLAAELTALERDLAAELEKNPSARAAVERLDAEPIKKRPWVEVKGVDGIELEVNDLDRQLSEALYLKAKKQRVEQKLALIRKR
jgi:hypothetical protein